MDLCPELKVSSFGDTSQEALDSVKEALALFLEGCQEMGTLQVVLEEAGYRPVGDQWLPRQRMAEVSHERTGTTDDGEECAPA